jgi:hypothetical protein
MKPIYFKTRDEVEKVFLEYIDRNYPNKFQDAMSIARVQIREFKKGFAIQFGDYGPYLQKHDLLIK